MSCNEICQTTICLEVNILSTFVFMALMCMNDMCYMLFKFVWYLLHSSHQKSTDAGTRVVRHRGEAVRLSRAEYERLSSTSPSDFLLSDDAWISLLYKVIAWYRVRCTHGSRLISNKCFSTSLISILNHKCIWHDMISWQ